MRSPLLARAAGILLVVLSAACAPAPGERSSGASRLSEDVKAARQLREQGRFQEALAAYDRALSENPRDSVALLESVSLLIFRDRVEEAQARARNILTRDPGSAVATLALAQAVYRQGDRGRAGTLLDQAASRSPADPAFYPPAARLYHALARTGRSVELLRQAHARGLADSETLGLLGELCLKLTRPREAEEAYREALRRQPNSADLQRNLGRSLLMQNRKKEAEEAFRAALRLNPEDPYALYYLGSLELDRGDPGKAVDLLSRSLSRDELNPKARYTLARSLLRLGRRQEAEEEFARHARLMERLYHRTEGGPDVKPADPLSPGTADAEWEDWVGAVEQGKAGDPSGAPPEKTGPGGRFYFVDVARESGISLRNVSGGRDKDYIIESLGSGACWIDHDGDGRLDLYLVNGRHLQEEGGSPPRDALYRNQEDGNFTDVTSRAGLRETGWGYGCAVGDFDNDGDPDLYVTHRGPNALFRNNGDGTFSEMAHAAGVDDPRWSTSAAFADYDQDGYLDLVVADYVEFDLARTPRPGSGEFCRFLGMPVFCGPRGLPMAKNRLYRNRGNGTFEDVTSRSGLRIDRGYYSLGVVWGDVDDDGDADLYVATDSTPNLLYQNNGDGTFGEVAPGAGVAYNEEGREQASMGTDMADYDNDGDLDIVVTNFSHDVDTLYRQDSPMIFSDVAYASGIGEPTLLPLGWGVGFVDFDNDGWKDLFMANGHTQPQIDRYDLATTYRQRSLLFQNQGDGTFLEVGRRSGPGLARALPARGAAFADYDNDGDVDVAVNNIDETASLLRNESGNRSHWIGVKLVGTRSNRDAIGARVTLTTGRGRQVMEVHAGYSYLASNDLRLLFGLGPDPVSSTGEVRIRWPDRSVQVLWDLPLDRYTQITQSPR